MLPRGTIPTLPLMILLAGLIGVLGGLGATGFTYLIHFVSEWTVEPVFAWAEADPIYYGLLCLVPALGMVVVSWFTRTFAPRRRGTACRRSSRRSLGTMV